MDGRGQAVRLPSPGSSPVRLRTATPTSQGGPRGGLRTHQTVAPAPGIVNPATPRTLGARVCANPASRLISSFTEEGQTGQGGASGPSKAPNCGRA